jgi:hypothetical protein
MLKDATASLACGSTTTILASCAPHRGPRVFAPLLVQARDGEVVLEAQVTGGCQIVLDEAGVSVLFDFLGAWLTKGELTLRRSEPDPGTG